jgi:predicted permease
LNSLVHDLRVGLRLLWKDKAFSATTLLTLALCIGANTALFSVIHNVLLRPLPIEEAEQIVTVSNLYPKAGAARLGAVGVPDYYDRKRLVSSFVENALYRNERPTVDQHGSPLRLRAQSVTPSFFRVLRAQAAMGRTFTEDEGEPGNDKKVVLSYALWQSQFGGSPSAIGRELRLDSRPFTVVGVMPRSFEFLNPDVMLWTPLAFTAEQKSDEERHSNNWSEIARLKPGTSLEQAQSQVDAVNVGIMDVLPNLKPLLINAGFRSSVTRLQDDLVADVKATLYLMWGGALFVLLIGCVNVANLVLVRSRVRLKELATRLALGAGRWRIARQLVTESVLLTLIAAAAGLFVGYLALTALSALSLRDLPRASEIRLDGVVIAWTVAMSAIIGIILGLIPVATVLPLNLTTVLREEGRSGTAARGARTARRALVVLQVAFAFVLLIGAGLLLRSFANVLMTGTGVRAEHVLTVQLRLPSSRYKESQSRQFARELIDRLHGVPGVQAAAVTNSLPFSNYSLGVFLTTDVAPAGTPPQGAPVIAVTPEYFTTFGVPILAGTMPRPSENGALASETFVKRFFPGNANTNPIGRSVRWGKETATITGIVADVKHAGPEKPAEPELFIPYDRVPGNRVDIAIRTSATQEPLLIAQAVRQQIHAIDNGLPIGEFVTLDRRLSDLTASRRLQLWMVAGFAAFGLLLATVGLYASIAYTVNESRGDIALRMALGAEQSHVRNAYLRRGLRVCAIGLAIGAIASLGLVRSIESVLFEIRPLDPINGIAAAAIMLATGLIATYVPARSAARTDPISVLRHE